METQRRKQVEKIKLLHINYPDLVPVSSTVIPLPIYKVSSAGYNIKPLKEDELNQRPKGPVSLITVNSKKRVIPQEKKPTVKQVTKKP
uniref:Uncharacterized protein n=1 Tax=Dendroctonus ponderosae TaxID=77166 RepID=A0AAR5QK28_DENPD